MLFGISKTTIEGVLSFIITTMTFIAGYQGLTAVLNPAQSHIWLIVTVVSTFAVGLCQVWVRQLEGDAPATATTAPAAKIVPVVLCAIALSVALVGCKTAATPLPSWAVNGQQALVGDVIAGADAAVVQYETDVKGGYRPPVSERAAMQAIQESLAIAQPEYNTWAAALKANPAAVEPANLNAVISTIQTALATLPTLTH
jgi:hypothetical protein